MKYKVTLNGRTYEVEVEAGKAMLLDEYEAIVPTAAPAAAPVAAPAAAPAAATPAAAPAATVAGEAVKAPMPGTILKVNVAAGQLKLHDVPPKTAAMLMAIVADKMGKPLNELRFISIKEVK